MDFAGLAAQDHGRAFREKPSCERFMDGLNS
jgi:hypothetical protein